MTAGDPGTPRWQWLLPLRVACIVGFGGLMAWEWMRWPNGSRLLGPLGLIWYGFTDPGTVLLSIISVLCVILVLLWPRWIACLISLLGLVNWVFWGMMAQGIGC